MPRPSYRLYKNLALTYYSQTILAKALLQAVQDKVGENCWELLCAYQCYAPLPPVRAIVGQGGDLINLHINCPNIRDIPNNQIPDYRGSLLWSKPLCCPPSARTGGGGVVGHNIDRCIRTVTREKVTKGSSSEKDKTHKKIAGAREVRGLMGKIPGCITLS